jgi:hypothetical protein
LRINEIINTPLIILIEFGIGALFWVFGALGVSNPAIMA